MSALASPADPAAALAAADAVAGALAAHARRGDEEGRFLEEDLAALRNSGLLALMVPSRLGGSGASFSDYARVAGALARGNGAPALVFNMHASVTGALALAPDDLTRNLGAGDGWFAARDAALVAAREGAFYAVAMSERGSGARLSSLTTSYEPVGGDFHLTGAKTFVSGADLADAFLVAARAAEDAARVSFFLVPAGAGTKVEQSWDALGMRATGSNDLHLDVTVGREALVGGVEGLGLLIARLMPQWLVASYAAVYVGVARACLDACVAHVNERGLSRLPAIRARLGRADAAVAAAGLVVEEAARHVDEAPGARETNRAVYRAKLLAGDTANEVASSMLEAAGASATRRGHPLERLYRDARCGALQPATSDVCADWLGLVALGLDPDDAETPRW
ncbi:MAG TPA: acyl-CoA dehydrogenase family protein [Acidimicrobiales bacterium]|nr:acyl-CoA dehydrogenase family protein [Acidimicrobiales bacterium]